MSTKKSSPIRSRSKNIKLIKIVKSPNTSKKYRAFFIKNGREKITDFGQKGASDYTIHKDKDRRYRYIVRHKKDMKTLDPTRAGYLSMFILWNKPSFNGSLKDYRSRLAKYNKTGRFPIKI